VDKVSDSIERLADATNRSAGVVEDEETNDETPDNSGSDEEDATESDDSNPYADLYFNDGEEESSNTDFGTPSDNSGGLDGRGDTPIAIFSAESLRKHIIASSSRGYLGATNELDLTACFLEPVSTPADVQRLMQCLEDLLRNEDIPVSGRTAEFVRSLGG
jgi:hypothetical protein